MKHKLVELVPFFEWLSQLRLRISQATLAPHAQLSLDRQVRDPRGQSVSWISNHDQVRENMN